MTGIHRTEPWIRSLWLSIWPLWALLAFASLAAVRFLPAGYIRTVAAAPILLVVPGSLVLGALFSQRHRPRGLVFVSYAAMLSAVLSASASLALYADGVLVTAQSTYWCLLAVSAVLAITAEARLLLGRPGKGRRAVRNLQALNIDFHDDEVGEAETKTAVRSAGYYSIVAVVAGVSLLAGGLYAYDHLPHPAPVGYTWLAWSGPPVTSDIVVGSVGTKLSFEIVHHQSNTTAFKLTASWLGTPTRPLAKPLTFSMGPNRTFQGALFIPPLPNGCTYRVVVALTAAQQMDPLTKQSQSWSINADVHDPSKSSKTCKA